jgi:hypothetical protein
MLSFHADSNFFECTTREPIHVQENVKTAPSLAGGRDADGTEVTEEGGSTQDNGGDSSTTKLQVSSGANNSILDDDATVLMLSEDEAPYDSESGEQRKKQRLDDDESSSISLNTTVSNAESDVIIVRKNSENKYCWENAFAEAFGTKDDFTKHRILGRMANKVVRRMDLPRVGNLLADRMAQAMMRHIVDNEHDIAERLVKVAVSEIDWIGELRVHAREELELAIGMQNGEEI